MKLELLLDYCGLLGPRDLRAKTGVTTPAVVIDPDRQDEVVAVPHGVGRELV